MKYYCEENKKFYNTEEECLQATYDYKKAQDECARKQKELKEQRAKREKALEDKRKSIEKQIDEYIEMVRSFNKDYRASYSYSLRFPLVGSLFGGSSFIEF